MSMTTRQMWNNWKFRFFNNTDKDDPAGILGFVWVTGDTDLNALQNQVDDTEVWNKTLPNSSSDNEEQEK